MLTGSTCGIAKHQHDAAPFAIPQALSLPHVGQHILPSDTLASSKHRLFRRLTPFYVLGHSLSPSSPETLMGGYDPRRRQGVAKLSPDCWVGLQRWRCWAPGLIALAADRHDRVPARLAWP